MNKNTKIVLALLITMVVIGASYSLGTQKNKLASNVQSGTPASSQTTDQTANWKAYTDTKSGFSLKYPSDYFTYQGDPSLGFILTTSVPEGGKGAKFLGENDARLGASSTDITDLNETLDQYLSKQQSLFKDSQKNISKKSVMIGGLAGYKVTYAFQTKPEGTSSNTLYASDGMVIKNGKLYSVSLSSFNQKLLDNKQTMFDQILSTFKFIIPVATDKSNSTTAAAPNAVIYEMHFYPHNATSDYEGHDNIKFDEQKKVAVFNNGNIYFEYEPNKYTLSYQILNNPPESPKEKQTQIINLEDTNNKYKLVMKLHMYGIGGGCPDFPKGFEMSSVILDNKNIFKAKFIDEKTASLNWPLGKIYLVDKGQYGWNCPNVAGLSSVKNGSVDIQYDLSLFGQNYNSQDYIAAEKSLDKVVSTIRNFWQ